MQLAEIQKRFPGADVAINSVIALVKGKHYNLGLYIGDGAFSPSEACLKLIAEQDDVVTEEPVTRSHGPKSSKQFDETIRRTKEKSAQGEFDV